MRKTLDLPSSVFVATAFGLAACASSTSDHESNAKGGSTASAGAPSAGAVSLGGAANSAGAGGNVASAGGNVASTGGAPAEAAGGRISSGGAVTSSGGAAGSTSANGGTASGGSVNAGAPNGGTSGGATNSTNGGSTSAGAANGGSASAGAANGGSASAGAANGGTSSGGSAGAAGASAMPDPGQPIGFASLNGGTVGGKGGQVVTASTYAELKSYAESASAYVIRVQGTISNGADGGKISIKSNKTLQGVGSTAFLNGVGLEINNSNNVIVQNLRVSLIGVTTRTDKAGVYSSTGDGGLPQILVNGGDAISISGTSKNVWIDHCELFSEDPAQQTNKDLYDGLVDIKGQTGFITVSWCYLHDHHKGGLVGASDSDLFADRKVTLHHNYYDNVKLRIPMYRGSIGHFFNNYVVGATDASEIRAGTCVRIEKNYYEALHYSIYTPSDAPGSTERIDNIEVSRTSRAYPANCSADIPYSYSSTVTNAADVKTLVPKASGVGKL